MARYTMSVTNEAGITTYSKHADKHAAMRAYEYGQTQADTWFVTLARKDTLGRISYIRNFQNATVHARKMAQARA